MSLDEKVTGLVAELSLLDNSKLRTSYFFVGDLFGCAVQSTKYQDGIIASFNFTVDIIESRDIKSLSTEMINSLEKEIQLEYDNFMWSSCRAKSYPSINEKRRTPAKDYNYNPPKSPLMQEIDRDTEFYGRRAAMEIQGLDDKDYEFW